VNLKFWKKKAPGATEEGEPDGEAPATVPPRNLKKRLIMGGTIGLLVLLLAGIGFATWETFLSHPEQKPAARATAETLHASQQGPHAETLQAEIAALKKKNDELRAQIEAIKKDQPQQQPPASPTREMGENAASASSSSSSEMTITNKDPKAAAQALKAAIEAMNAESGGRKPRKPTP
jgi:hypothetical protein